VSAKTQLPANDTLQAVHGALLSAKPVRLDGAFLTARQVHAFCDHLEVLLRSRVFTLLTDPQSIMAISLRFITSKVMARVPVADWKMNWEVSTIIEALSAHSGWQLREYLRQVSCAVQVDAEDGHGRPGKHRPVAQELLRASHLGLGRLWWHASGPRKPSPREVSKEFSGNRLFQLDLDEALGKDAAYMVKPSRPGLLAAAQVVMNTWEKEYFKQLYLKFKL
jgi:hypothetical protein